MFAECAHFHLFPGSPTLVYSDCQPNHKDTLRRYQKSQVEPDNDERGVGMRLSEIPKSCRFKSRSVDKRALAAARWMYGCFLCGFFVRPWLLLSNSCLYAGVLPGSRGRSDVSPKASPPHPFWLWPNLLSLDAPLIAVLWLHLFALSGHIRLSPIVG